MSPCLDSPSRISSPLTAAALRDLTCGRRVLLTGPVLLAREAALRRMAQEIERGKALPFNPEGAVLFHGGFTPPPPEREIGSIGPTTSLRMDPWTPPLLRAGVRGMIGKGKRSPKIVAAILEFGAVYLGATGGAAALLSRSVRSVYPLLFGDLGSEEPYLLEVFELPLVVAIDAEGNDLFEQGQKKFIKGTNQKQNNGW